MKRELIFLFAVWKANLLSAMEYRAAFISQVAGMILNDAMYFLFWVIFFNKFEQVSGWQLPDMFLLFGIVAAGFGLGTSLFGNAMQLSDAVATGKLDYYLALPRPVLLHLLATRTNASGMGDVIYGVMSFFLAGQLTLDAFARFLLGTLFSMTIFISFLVLVQSLAFWMGHSQLLSNQATNAMITFAVYPITLFEGSARFILFTLIPAAFVGAIPAEFVRTFTWGGLAQLVGASVVMLSLAVFVFYRGLRRYESGSAIQIQL